MSTSYWSVEQSRIEYNGTERAFQLLILFYSIVWHFGFTLLQVREAPSVEQ